LVHDGDQIKITDISIYDYYYYDIYSDSECVSECNDCFNDDNLELFTPDISKPSMKYKVGDVVKIKSNSKYEEQNDRIDNGKIKSIEKGWGYDYSIIFSNGYENNYDSKDLELVTPEITNSKPSMKYKVGDILKPKKGHERVCGNYLLHDGGHIKITGTTISGCYRYSIYSDSICVSLCNSCFKDGNLELISPEITNSKPSMKKRYILLKDTPVVKKGAIYEEMSDDDYFKLITPEFEKSTKKLGDDAQYRESIVNNPEWYEEVVPACFTKEQLEEIIKIIKAFK